jgi:bHLH factor
MSENMSPVDGSNKRKRDTPDSGDAQRMNRHAPAHNGGMQGIQGAPSSTNNSHYYSAAEHPVAGYDTHGLASNGNELSRIDQQLLQHVGGAHNGVTDDNTMTAKAALAHQPQSEYPPPDAGFDNNSLGHSLTFGDDVNAVPMPGVHGHNSTAAAVYAAREAQNMGQKPAVGSAEWHTIRKNNHKEGKILQCLPRVFPFINPN